MPRALAQRAGRLRSTWRSCQSVNASSPHSCREQVLAAGDVLVDQARTTLGSK